MSGMDTTPTIERRKRFSAFKPGLKPKLTLAPTSKIHLAILDAAQEYDAIWSSYLTSLFDSPAYIEDRITELLKGHYMGVMRGWSHDDKLHRERPLQVWPRGYTYLGELNKERQLVNDHANHKILRSTLEFHADRLPAAITKLPNPTIDLGEKMLSPDRTWKVTYRNVRDATMWFHEEDDTGSERVKGNRKFEARKKTVRTMLKNYVSYFEQGLFKPTYPTMSVLIHTTKAKRMETILQLIESDDIPERWRDRFNVKAVPDFVEEPLLLPEPTDNVISTDYIRIKNGQRQRFNIMDTLKATELRKRGGE